MPVRYLPSNIIMGCVPCKSNTKLDEKPLNEEIDSGEQEERLVKEAEAEVKKALEKMNNFILNDWTNYRKLVESKPLKMFKDYKVIE